MAILERLFKRQRKDVALVLSSGGARGLAHIGAIDALSDRGFRITSLAGTSFGSIVAGFYAAGKLEDFKLWMTGIDSKKVRSLTDYSLGFASFVKGERIIEELEKIAPDRNIEDLDIPLSVIATDWKTGKEVVFTRGSMWKAIRASISVPGFFAPVEYDSKVLIDGGITNPLPLDRVARNGEDLLVGINVSGHDYGGMWQRKQNSEKWLIKNSKFYQLLYRMLPKGADPSVNYFTLLNQTVSIAIAQNARRSIMLNKPDILVDIPMKRYSGSDYDKYEHISKVGMRKTNAAINKFLGIERPETRK